MRRITEEDLTVRDATGRDYRPRAVAIALADTVARTIGVGVVLFAIGLIWQAFH